MERTRANFGFRATYPKDLVQVKFGGAGLQVVGLCARADLVFQVWRTAFRCGHRHQIGRGGRLHHCVEKDGAIHLSSENPTQAIWADSGLRRPRALRTAIPVARHQPQGAAAAHRSERSEGLVCLGGVKPTILPIAP